MSILTDRDPDGAAGPAPLAPRTSWPRPSSASGPRRSSRTARRSRTASTTTSRWTPRSPPTTSRRSRAEMEKIVAGEPAVHPLRAVADEGMERLKNEGNKYKIDNAERAIAGGAKCSQLVRHRREGQELGRPLHGPARADAPGKIKAFKVMSVAQSQLARRRQVRPASSASTAPRSSTRSSSTST